MKIPELRKQIEEYKDEQLRYLIVQLYKTIPKTKKEEAEIDDLILNLQEYSAKKKKEKIPENIYEWASEIELFIENANQLNYCQPNRVIPKKDRSKWRSKVKQYYKILNEDYQDPKEKKLAAQLLEKLYRTMSAACLDNLFNTADPFLAIGIDQADFNRRVITKTFKIQKSRKTIASMVDMASSAGTGPNVSSQYVMSPLVFLLTSDEDKYIAIEEAEKLHEKLALKEQYAYKQQALNLVVLEFLIYMSLGEYDKAIKRLKNNRMQMNIKSVYGFILYYLKEENQKERWIKEYKEAEKKNIYLGYYIDWVYDFLKNNDRFPDDDDF